MPNTSPLVGPQDPDGMLLQLGDRLQSLEQTSTLEAGVVAYIPTGQPSDLIWHDMSFAAGFSNYGSIFAPCQYTKDGQGMVYLRGLTKFTPTGVYGNGSMGVTLPAGFRPMYSSIFHVIGSSTSDYHFRLDINADGTITRSIIQGGNWDGGYMSYEAINFYSGFRYLADVDALAASYRIPDGWLYANGAPLSPSRYGQLAKRLKQNVLPDLRGSAPSGTLPIIKF